MRIRAWGSVEWPHCFTSLPYLAALIAMRPRLPYPDPAVVA